MERYGIVQWGSCRFTEHTAGPLSRILGVPVQFLEPAVDALYEGPHHLDLDVQEAMRTAYFRQSMGSTQIARGYLEHLHAGQPLVVWGTRNLTSCLGGLWLLDWLQTHQAPLERVSLVADPASWASLRSPERLRELFAGRLPVEEVCGELVALRRQIASPDWEFRLDFGALPEPVRSWAALAERLIDWVPDDRGLDLYDGLLLEALTPEWKRAVVPIAHAVKNDPRENGMGDLFLWERLVQLSDQCGVFLGWWQREDDRANLCELRINGPAAVRSAKVRITPTGEAVRAGRADALQHRNLFRWVGGRLLASGRTEAGKRREPDFDRREARP